MKKLKLMLTIVLTVSLVTALATTFAFASTAKVKVYASYVSIIRGQIYTPKSGGKKLLTATSKANILNSHTGNNISFNLRPYKYAESIIGGEAGTGVLYITKNSKNYEVRVTVYEPVSVHTGYLKYTAESYKDASQRCSKGKLASGSKVTVVGVARDMLRVKTSDGSLVYVYNTAISHTYLYPNIFAKGVADRLICPDIVHDICQQRST